MPFFWQGPQSFRQYPERADFHGWFPAFGKKACPLDADEIADVEQAKKLDQLRANFFCVNIDLNAPGGVAQVEKVAFAHIAVRGDAASHTKYVTLFKFFAHLRDGSARLKTGAEWLNAFPAKGVEFFPSQGDQLVLFVHHRRANVKRRGEINSLKETSSRSIVEPLEKLQGLQRRSLRCNDVTF